MGDKKLLKIKQNYALIVILFKVFHNDLNSDLRKICVIFE